MFALMAGLEGIDEREQRDIEVRARDLEGLLVAWLSELLYYVDAEELLFRRFDVARLTDTQLKAVAFGERIDRERHELHLGVKAVTRHMLEIAREDGGYRARILFDI